MTVQPAARVALCGWHRDQTRNQRLREFAAGFHSGLVMHFRCRGVQRLQSGWSLEAFGSKGRFS